MSKALFTLNNPAINLIKLSPGMMHKIFYLQYLTFIYSFYFLEFL